MANVEFADELFRNNAPIMGLGLWSNPKKKIEKKTIYSEESS